MMPLSLIIIAIVLLAVLAVIDLKHYLLPNIYVAPLAISGALFHITNDFEVLSLNTIIFGALVGFLSLYLIRAVANYYYKQDSLGLGDVKLMGAAGIWLGLDSTLLALTIGAFAGLLHGLCYGFYQKNKHKKKIDFNTLSIPAGPGFIVGILFVAIPLYKNFVLNMIATILQT